MLDDEAGDTGDHGHELVADGDEVADAKHLLLDGGNELCLLGEQAGQLGALGPRVGPLKVFQLKLEFLDSWMGDRYIDR